MSEIRVPERMLEAVAKARGNRNIQWTDEQILTAALRWLSENPIAPTVAQINAMYDDPRCPKEKKYLPFYLTEWQRRMFRAEEPPDPCAEIIRKAGLRKDGDAAEAVREAYRLGRASHDR